MTWHEHIILTILACNMMTLYAPFILLGLPRNQMVIPPAITIMTNTWSQTVILPAITTTPNTWPQTVILLAITTMTNTWPQTVILPAITTNLSPHRTMVVIKNIIIIITVDSQCDRHKLGPYPRAWLSIDSIYTLQRLVHCTHTTEPMASHSHSGGPTVFRQNWSTAMTLSQPLRLTPHWASPGWPRVYQRHNDHRRGLT